MADPKVSEVGSVFVANFFDKRFRRDRTFLGFKHRCRAVSIVGTHVVALIAFQTLKANPDIGLNMLKQVPHVDRTVGIRQGTGDQDAALTV